MTPERLKEIREILDDVQPYEEVSQDIVEELYDEVSSRMPVSVEERLPEEDQTVEAWPTVGKDPHWALGAYCEGSWIDQSADPVDVTHWRAYCCEGPATGVPQ
jgi:hypothetical protein